MFGMPVLDKYYVSVKIFFRVWGVLGWDMKEWKGAKGLEWGGRRKFGVCWVKEKDISGLKIRGWIEQTSDHLHQLFLVGSRVKRTPQHETLPYLCALHIQLLGFYRTFSSLFLEFNFLSMKYKERPDKREMTSETSSGLPFPPRNILTHCCPFDWRIPTMPLFSRCALWAHDVFISAALCITVAQLLLLGTTLSEMTTSKTLCATCLCRGNLTAWERRRGRLVRHLFFFDPHLSSNRINNNLHSSFCSYCLMSFLYFLLPLFLFFLQL